MRSFRSLTFAFTGILTFACWQSQSAAQVLNGAPMQASGTVAAVDFPNLEMLVSDGNGGTVVLDFKQERIWDGITIQAPDPQARVVGPLMPQAVSVGMTVRVTGKVRELEKFVDPITQIDVTGLGIVPTASYGAFPEAVLGITPEEEEAGVQGFVIAGQIQRIRRGRIYIAIPLGNGESTIIQGEVADDVQVSIDVADLRPVTIGDRVDFDGYSPDGRHVFVYNATFNKPDLNIPVAGAAPGPNGAPEEQQPFGVPDAGQDEAAPVAEPDDQPSPEDTAMEEGDEAAEAAQPEKPGRVVRIN